MADSNKDKKKKDAYSQMAVLEEERAVEVPVEAGDGHKTLAERLEEKSELTDIQSAIASLFPKGLGDITTNAVMVGRIAPDAFLPLLHIMTMNDILRSDPSKPINFTEALVKNYILLTIGLDGKGRIDQVELAGASKESEELSKLGKELGGL